MMVETHFPSHFGCGSFGDASFHKNDNPESFNNTYLRTRKVMCYNGLAAASTAPTHSPHPNDASFVNGRLTAAVLMKQRISVA
jgi:hypothetical protein